MARHFRRHLVRQSDFWVALFNVSTEPQQLANRLSTDCHAQLAFAEMVWANQMEPRVHERRWPYRDPWLAGGDPFHGELAPAGMAPSADALSGTGSPLNTAARRWIECHAAGFTMMSMWRAAWKQTMVAAQTSMTESQICSTGLAYQIDWSALERMDGSFLFLGLSSDDFSLSGMQRPNKRARCEAALKVREVALQEVRDACAGPCLTWSHGEGWYVSSSARPAANGWHRHRLLGFKGKRPLFWIFPDGELFAARLCAGKLQTFGTTAKTAIAALRESFKQFVRPC